MKRTRNSRIQDDIERRYRRRKLWFWGVLLLMLLLVPVLLFYLWTEEPEEEQGFVTAASCGCVKDRGVYRLPEDSDLASLVYASNGLTPYADIRHLDLEQTLVFDSVYHIPCRSEKMDIADPDLQPLMPSDSLRKAAAGEELKNFLYVGLPAVYILIQYSITHKIINIIYIPHSTVLLQNDYRLIDYFFTLGIEPTVDILCRKLKQPVDHYFIQSKTSFIRMIDELGGLRLNIDERFAAAHDLEHGKQLLDGALAYEYIRFVDQKRHFRSKGGTKSLEDLKLETSKLQLAFAERQVRQKKVINALHQKFNFDRLQENIPTIKTLLKEGSMDTSIDYETAIWVFRHLMEGTRISFGTLPGTYKTAGNNNYYIPGGPGFELLQRQKTRELFELNKSTNPQILY